MMKKTHLGKALFGRKSVVFWTLLLLVLVVPLILAPYIAPNDIYEQDILNKFAAPSAQFPFGTDNLGRCIFSRLLYGGRTTIGYAFITVLLSALIGISLGILAGYVGGLLDSIIMRICDVMYAFPSTVLTLVFVAIVGRGMGKLVGAMLITGWISFARISRNVTRSEKNHNYISAARINGCSHLKIMIRHIFPSVAVPLIALFTINFGHTILSISGFSFLGLGVQPPAPELGAMIDMGRDFIYSHPMIMFWPGLLAILVVIALNIIGDNLQDSLQEVRS